MFLCMTLKYPLTFMLGQWPIRIILSIPVLRILQNYFSDAEDINECFFGILIQKGSVVVW